MPLLTWRVREHCYPSRGAVACGSETLLYGLLSREQQKVDGMDDRGSPKRDSRHLAEHEAHITVKDGVLFQTGGCPQSTTLEEAEAKARDDSLLGNTINLTSQSGGRTGNHFANLSQYFSMAYCCKSKVLTMPKDDLQIPTEDGGKFVPLRRWFDFSQSKVMPLPEYDNLYQRPDVCLPNYEVGGPTAYRLHGVHEDLLDCMNRVYIRSCEAEYLGALVGTSDFCEPPRQPPIPRISAPENGAGANEGDTAGSLVIHIRSGDIFRFKRDKKVRTLFGQPPLQFFLEAIASESWSDVSILTFADEEAHVNPTFTALELFQKTGLLGPKVAVYKNRPLLTDLREMLCADALAVARSSMHILTFAHTRASHFFVPGACGPGTYKRGPRFKGDGTPKVSADNTTLLCIEKPNAEVYGIDWEIGPQAYSVYNSWRNTVEQRLEMVLFKGLKGLQRCCARA